MWGLTCLAWIFGSLAVKVRGQTCACHATGGCNFTDSCRPPGNCRERNVALGKSATMSSVFKNTTLNETSGPACLAVNGNTGTTFRPINQFPSNPACVRTADGDEHPFWEVDLGQEFAIAKITVIRRYAERLKYAQLSVDGKVVRPLPSNAALESGIKFDPPLLGSTVRLSQNLTDPGDNDAFINLCELQVWACVEGYYGSSCNQKCGACLNASTCDAVTGTCKGECDPGWQGPMCDKKCPGGTCGKNCSQQCGHCKNGVPCDHMNGKCYSRCVGGYQAPLCQKVLLEVEFLVARAVGSFVGGLLLIVVCIIIVDRCMRRSKIFAEIRQSLKSEEGSRTPAVKVYSIYCDMQPIYENFGRSEEHYEALGRQSGEYSYEILPAPWRQPGDGMDASDIGCTALGQRDADANNAVYVNAAFLMKASDQDVGNK